MRGSYFPGLVAHLIDTHPHPDVVNVETFADLGAVGPNWPPAGIKLTMRDGSAVWMAFNCTSAAGGNRPDQPTEFRPEDLNVPCM